MYEDLAIEDPPQPTPTTAAVDVEATSATAPTADAQCHSADASQATEDDETSGEKTIELLGHLPPEMATLLMIAGAAGVVLPGPVGTPLLIAGCVMMWPKTFRPIELWFSRRFPKFHREGVIQIKEFVADLKMRFPDGE